MSRSWNPLELLGALNWIGWVALLVLVLVVALAVFLIRWLHFARKRRRYGKGTKW